MKTYISFFVKLSGLAARCILTFCCCLIFHDAIAQTVKKTKKDSVYAGYPFPEYEMKGDKVFTAEEKKKLKEEKEKTYQLRKELMEKLRDCPKGKDGDYCRKEYHQQLAKLEAEEKRRLEEMLRKYGVDKKYGADPKIPDDKYKDYKPDYDRMALFIPKNYKELPAYRRDPAVRRAYDDIKRDEEKLIKLFKALDKCPSGRAGAACKKDLQRQVRVIRTQISQKLNKALTEKKMDKLGPGKKSS